MNIVSCESLIKIVMHQDDNVFTYDTMNRIDTMLFTLDGQTALFDYAYDLIGRQTQSALTLNNVADRTVNIEYDYLGRALSAELTGNALNDILAEFDYNSVGALTNVNRYEWDDTDDLYELIAKSNIQYNARNQITSINHQDSNNNNIVTHSYLYNADGNISQYTNSLDGSVLYDYDFLGQLIGADYSNLNIPDESYQYDLNGNRELVTNANGDLVVYSTGTNNELISDGAYTYAYDAEGNRISKTNAAGTERELYTWDYRNRLSSVTKQTYDSVSETWQTVQIVEYAYDYNNVLIRKVLDANGDGVSDSKTIFIPEDYQVAIQLDDADLSDSTYETVSHRYLWTPGQQDKLLADVTPTETLWTLTDHLGTVRDIIQNTQSGLIVPAHVIYDAYGNVLSCKDPNGTDVSNPVIFGFTGKYFDADTQLQNNINRWYDATTGRWLSTDPIGFEGNDTNLYLNYLQYDNINSDSQILNNYNLGVGYIINNYLEYTFYRTVPANNKTKEFESKKQSLIMQLNDFRDRIVDEYNNKNKSDVDLSKVIFKFDNNLGGSISSNGLVITLPVNLKKFKNEQATTFKLIAAHEIYHAIYLSENSTKRNSIKCCSEYWDFMMENERFAHENSFEYFMNIHTTLGTRKLFRDLFSKNNDTEDKIKQYYIRYATVVSLKNIFNDNKLNPKYKCKKQFNQKITLLEVEMRNMIHNNEISSKSVSIIRNFLDNFKKIN